MWCDFCRHQGGRVADVDHHAVDPRRRNPALRIALEDLLVLALAAADQRGQDHDPRPLGPRQQRVEHLLGRLLADRRAAAAAMGLAQPRVKQPQVIVDFGDRGHRAPRIVPAGALIDGDRRLQALDEIDVGPLELMEELPGVDRQAFDVLPLPFGIERVEGQGTLARPAGTGDHHQPVAGEVEVDVLQVVHAGAANADALVEPLR